ncbi:TatD family hydrolase [Cloacibacterium rupense]|uniref:TatD family hydrolase n=1 Tax=Cloacibacterium rupense TaxID=517423 RepID=A0ABQ2NHZ9_9FLAO|nr:TatD family hydrolase [Cloacibacterium rupense]GGP03845.1 TatD family hydrolase [Cloacibacterium rupense]
MTNFLFDTHAHLDLSTNFYEEVNSIEKLKIYTIAVTNLPPLYIRFKSRIESKYIKPALGFHPELIEKYQKYIPQMWNLLDEAKYIGEVGLDYKVAINSKAIQLSFFESLIHKCNDLGGKVLTIHSRNSVDDVLSIIGSKFNSKFILHWYSGNLKNIDIAVANGAYFSINNAMFNSNNGLKIINQIPTDRLLLESDYPFVINKDKTPFRVTDINETVSNLAKLKDKDYDDMLGLLNINLRKILS